MIKKGPITFLRVGLQDRSFYDNKLLKYVQAGFGHRTEKTQEQQPVTAI